MNGGLEQAYEDYDQHLEDAPKRADYGGFDEYSLAVDAWLCEFYRQFNRVVMAETRANMKDAAQS